MRELADSEYRIAAMVNGAPFVTITFIDCGPDTDVKLSTGRVVVHRKRSNGSQDAIATPGDYALTEAEWQEYARMKRSA